MKRAIEAELDAWCLGITRKPLIVRGARQVGKTYTITEFGKNRFKCFITIDFEREHRLHSLFKGDLVAARIFDRIMLEKGFDAAPEDTLLFFDEIQRCPRALMSLRYFQEEMPNVNIIAAGSLLELSLNDDPFPVGRVEFRWMFPMNFYEFLEAAGEVRLLGKIPHITSEEPIDEFAHEKLLAMLKTYFIVGGMPEAVRTYLETKSLTSVRKIHADLCHSYIEDFSKYNAKIDRLLMETIFRRLPVLTGMHLKYSHLAEPYRNETIRKGFDVLLKSLVVYRVTATTGGIPLQHGANEKIFKTVFIDIGLMQFLCDLPAGSIIDADNITEIYKGALAEQFIGQQLISSSAAYPQLYFWCRCKKNSQAELDYLVLRNNRLYPLEVKSGAAGSLKSLHLYLKMFPDVQAGYVLSHRNIAQLKEQRIKFVPLYARI